MKPTVRFFVCSLLCISAGYSQAQSFYKTFDVGMDPNVVTCTEKTDGDFLLLIQSVIPYSDYFYLTDLTAGGQVMWTKRLDFPHDDVLPLMMRSNDDSTYTILMNSFHKPTYDDRGVMLLNIDGNANVLWTNTYGENTNGCYEIPFTFSHTNSAGYVIAAQRDSGLSGYPALIVADHAGNFVWGKNYDFSTGGIGVFKDVHQSPDGGFIACGDAKPYGFLLKTDSMGNVQWMRKYHNNHVGYADMYSVALTTDSCFLAYGITSGNPQAATFLMKVDTNGNTVWLQTYNFYSPYLRPFPIYEAGGLFTFLSNVAYGANSNTTRFNVSKADANGNLIFSKLYHPSMKNVMSDMQLTHSNGLIASGYVTDTITMDKHGFFMKSFNAISTECLMDQVGYQTHSDTFNIDTGTVTFSFTGDAVPVVSASTDNIVDHNLCGLVTVEEPEENEWTISPNPAEENFTITYRSDQTMHAAVAILILDVTGRVVFRKEYEVMKNAIIDVSWMQRGIYFCRIEMNKKEMGVRKFVVSK
jgi:hypothetical protein